MEWVSFPWLGPISAHNIFIQIWNNSEFQKYTGYNGEEGNKIARAFTEGWNGKVGRNCYASGISFGRGNKIKGMVKTNMQAKYDNKYTVKAWEHNIEDFDDLGFGNLAREDGNSCITRWWYILYSNDSIDKILW